MTLFLSIFLVVFVIAMIAVAFWIADQRGKKTKPHTEHHQTPGNEQSVRVNKGRQDEGVDR